MDRPIDEHSRTARPNDRRRRDESARMAEAATLRRKRRASSRLMYTASLAILADIVLMILLPRTEALATATLLPPVEIRAEAIAEGVPALDLWP